MMLGNMASIYTGLQDLHRYREGETRPLQLVRSIVGGVPYVEFIDLNPSPTVIKNKALKKFDVLVTSKISAEHVDVALVEGDVWDGLFASATDGILLPNQTVLTIRTEYEAAARFLQVFFESQPGQEALMKAARPVNFKKRERGLLNLTVSGAIGVEIPEMHRWQEIMNRWYDLRLAQALFNKACRPLDETYSELPNVSINR